MGKKVKRCEAEKAADLLLEDGGMAKLDRDRLMELARLALRCEVQERMPGSWALWFVNHGDGCWSAGDSYEPLKSAAEKLRA